MMMTTEDLLVSPLAFGLATATPVQRAICRVLDGIPLAELAEDPGVVEAFGGVEAVSSLPATAPTELDLLSGIRTLKSGLAAIVAYKFSQTVDVSGLTVGEVPRVSVLSLDLDKASVVLDFLVGMLQARPALRRLMVGDPTSDSVLIRHPSGRPIEIKVVAGARAGAAVVSRWSAGCIFDEFTRMFGSGEAVVTFSDARRAVLGRLLPGAQILSIGSPWAPMGPAFERFTERFGKPSAEHVVVRARAALMNPVHWTPERIEKLRLADDFAYRTDALSDFADPSEAYISSAEIRRATRTEPMDLPTRPLPFVYICAIDPGTRGNSWTLVVMEHHTDDQGIARYAVKHARQWTGSSSEPLSPWAVLGEMKALFQQNEISNVNVWTDQHGGDFLRDLATRAGIKIFIEPTGAQNRSPMFEALKGAFATGVLEIPPNKQLASDLASVRRRLTQSGVTYDLPRSGDGRHADYVPALCLALSKMPRGNEMAAAGSRDARTLQILSGLALTASRYGFGAPFDDRYMSDDQRESTLAALSAGLPWAEASKSIWTRVYEANEREREQLHAEANAENEKRKAGKK